MQRIKTQKLKRRQKKQLAALTMIIMASGITAILLLTPLFDITEINVHGNSVVKDEEIVRSGGLIKGINIFSVSLGKAEKAIEQMGYIDNAKIRRRLPGELEITVVEAAGVARIQAKNGYIVITADGRAVGHITEADEKNGAENGEEKKFAGIPVIKGLKNVKYKIGSKFSCDDKERLEDTLTCLKAFSKNGQIFKMTQIDVSNLSDISFKYNEDRLDVKVGSCEKVDYKMECFGSILGELGEETSGFIDLERMTYRKKQE